MKPLRTLAENTHISFQRIKAALIKILIEGWKQAGVGGLGRVTPVHLSVPVSFKQPSCSWITVGRSGGTVTSSLLCLFPCGTGAPCDPEEVILEVIPDLFLQTAASADSHDPYGMRFGIPSSLWDSSQVVPWYPYVSPHSPPSKA